jgi:phytoene dehydrogenase-like protein
MKAGNVERRVVVIGAGPNGLVAAAVLARAGLPVVILERREGVGGLAATEEIHPGFRCPAVFSTMGPLAGPIAAGLALAEHGFELLVPDARVFAPSPDGRGVVIFGDPEKTAARLALSSPKDAERYPAFAESIRKIGRVLRPLLTMTPPAIDAPSASDLWRLLKIGKDFRGLGKRDAYRLLRWGPMAAADLVAEWFDGDLLRATVAARGLAGTSAGPWSAGTSAGILFQAALDGQATSPASFPRGGIGAFADALAAATRAAGGEIRTKSEVSRIVVRGGRVSGVVLSSGEELPAGAVVSGADPKTTFLRLVDSAELGPEFVQHVRNIRASGTTAKVNFALSAFPAFSGDGAATLGGRIHIGPGIDALERAFDASKYGDFSESPHLDMAIPSLLDPSLAPAGAHVLSVLASFAPYRLRSGDWSARRDELGDAVEKTIADCAPGFRELVVARRVLAPPDLEAEFGTWGGHLFHGEPALDQLFTMRPLLGWARYASPIGGLYLCGAGTHPGGGVTGLPGWNAAREILRAFRV